MLNRAHRLRRSSSFTKAVRGGRRAGRGTLVLHLRPDAGTGPPQVGFIVSRAVGGAVVRNRVRRRLRHLVRDRVAALPPGVALVVRALPGAAGAPYDRLGADLTAALRAVTRTGSGSAARRSR